MGPYRSTMDDLVARTRRYIGDMVPATGSPQFSDLDIQDTLDEHQNVVAPPGMPLRPAPTLQAMGIYDFLDYYASVGNWEADVILKWVDFSVLTPAKSDLITGHWTFDKPAPGQYPPVYITGKFYDLYGAAADLLERWCAVIADTAYNFSADGRSFQRGTIVQTKMALADQYRRKAFATSHVARRRDAAGPNPILSLGQGGPGFVTGDGEEP